MLHDSGPGRHRLRVGGDGGLIVNEGLILEIVRPGTGDPLPDGEVGEVVVTNLLAAEYPLVRFATGDLSAVLPGASPCGRTNVRIRGWLGRADQSAKVRGMFVHPSLVASIVRRHPEILRARLVVRRVNDADEMTLRCETASAGDEALSRSVVGSIREVCKLRGRGRARSARLAPQRRKSHRRHAPRMTGPGTRRNDCLRASGASTLPRLRSLQ